MDGSMGSISPQDLYRHVGTPAAPLVIDVRHDQALSEDNTVIVGALRRRPDEVENWLRDLPSRRSVVVHCCMGMTRIAQAVAWKTPDRLLSDIASQGGRLEINKGASDA